MRIINKFQKAEGISMDDTKNLLSNTKRSSLEVEQCHYYGTALILVDLKLKQCNEIYKLSLMLYIIVSVLYFDLKGSYNIM